MTVRAALGLCLVVLAAPSRAQDGADIVFRGVPATQALAAVADQAGIDVVYSTALVGDRPVWCGGAGWQAEDLLRCITDAVGLDYVRRSTGTYLVTAPVVERAARGAVAGRVLDAETGAPLPLAHVRLGTAATFTDGSGRFLVSDVPPGPHVLLASYVGYRSQAARVRVAPGAVAREQVGLRSQVSGVGTVVVRGIETRGASDGLGADVGFEVLPERVSGQPSDGASLSQGAPAATSSPDGTALRSLLGVGGRTYLDALSIQGSETGSHALTLDGAQIYEPLQLGPALGSLSALAVGAVTVRKAGFGARHGSHLSGVLEVRHDLARPREPAGRRGPRALEVAAEADPFAAGARLRHHGRLGTWGGEPVEVTALVAGRRSLWDVRPPSALDRSLRQWNDVDPVLAATLTGRGAPVRSHFDAHRHGSDVSFDDLHAVTRVQIGALRSVQASVYRGAAGIGTELFAVGASHRDAGGGAGPDPAAFVLARDDTRWTNTAASVRAEALVGLRWQVGLTGRWSDHSIRQRYDALEGGAAGLSGAEPAVEAEARLGAALDALGGSTNGNDLDDAALGLDASVAIARGQTLTLGVEGTSVGTRFHLLSAGFGETAFRDLDAEHRQTRLAAFADGRHALGARWTLEPGLRLTTRAASGDVFAEPRLAVRYDALPSDRALGVRLAGVAARLALGVYRQFATRVELATFGPSALVPDVPVWLPTDASLDPPSALHVAGEVLWRPSPQWSARVEGYAKAVPRTYDLDYAALLADGPAPISSQSDFLLAERGRSAGVGVRVERQTPRWAGSLGLALARAERQTTRRFRGAWVSAPWEEPVRATADLDVLVAGRRDGDGLLLRTRGLGVWGRSWALRRAYYDVVGAQTASLGAFLLVAPQDDRLAPLLTLDVGAAYTVRLGDGRRLEVAFDVTNVLDRRNVLDWSLRPGPGGALEAVTRTLPGVQPALRVRASL